MRVASAAVSVTSHVVFVVLAVWATTEAHPRVSRPHVVFELLPTPVSHGPVAPTVPDMSGDVTIPVLTLPSFDGIAAPAMPGFEVPRGPGPVFAPAPTGSGGPIDVSLVDQLPAMLAGPAPVYPDLLRQAGVQGRVVLEAVVDTAGHVEPGSVVVVERAHPAFVAPAQQAVMASLFRPARVRGVAVRVRVRIPIDFLLRDGRL